MIIDSFINCWYFIFSVYMNLIIDYFFIIKLVFYKIDLINDIIFNFTFSLRVPLLEKVAQESGKLDRIVEHLLQ